MSDGADYQAGMKRYIVTRTPRAGKTAIVRQLELHGFSVVEDGDRRHCVMAGEGDRGTVDSPRVHRRHSESSTNQKSYDPRACRTWCSFIIDLSFVPLLWQITFDVRGRKASCKS